MAIERKLPKQNEILDIDEFNVLAILSVGKWGLIVNGLIDFFSLYTCKRKL